MSALTIVFGLIFLVHLSNGQEPSCSKFDYDKRMLEMLIRMEADMKQRDEKQITMEQELNQERVFRTTLQEQLADSISEVQELKKSLQSMSTSLEVVNTELSDQKVNLQGQLADSISEIQKLKRSQSASLEDLKTELTDQITNPDAKLNQSRITDANTTFYFYMSRPVFEHGKMVFTKRTISDVTWYNASTGVLTIQEDGLYHLSYTFMTMSDSVSPYCQLFRNNAQSLFIQGKGEFQSTTASLFKKLEKGDTLDIRCSSTYFRHIHHGEGTFFTGAMIRPGN